MLLRSDIATHHIVAKVTRQESHVPRRVPQSQLRFLKERSNWQGLLAKATATGGP